MAEIAARGAHEPSNALEAELWVSGMLSTWRAGAPPGFDVDRLFGTGLVEALEKLGDAGALAALRAMAAVGAKAYASRARKAADRLADAGAAEPSWSDEVGRARPVAALLMCEDAFDDGVSVMVEFTRPSAQPHTLGVYIDHNMGGLVKDAFLAGPLADARATLARHDTTSVGLELRELDLAEARVRIDDALYMLDHTLDPPVSEDVRPLRALIQARARLLPEGAAPPDELEALTPQERTGLLADFLDSPEGRRWRDDEDAEDIVSVAIDFGADYNHGGPLRWSPVVVEIFMTDWLPRKITRELVFFQRVPDVLRDWVKYAGHRRGVPAAALRETVAAVKSHRKEMLQAAGDPHAWGPAKTFAVAAQQAGVDLSDQDAIDEFLEHYNTGLTA